MRENEDAASTQASFAKMKSSRLSLVLTASLLTLLVAAIFYQVVDFEFIDFDTYDQVVDNEYIRGLSYENVHHILTTRCITSYYPFRTLTYALNDEIFGLSDVCMLNERQLRHLYQKSGLPLSAARSLIMQASLMPADSSW